jgi:aminoglycoside phosphotransferase (APT) family kinase protein
MSMVDPRAVQDLLRGRPPDQALRWVLDSLGPGTRLRSVTALTGGMSHALHRINVQSADGPRSVVLRRWVRPGWRDENPHYTALHEAETLTLLADIGARAPRLIAVDDAATHADVPASLATYAPGAGPRITEANLDAVVAGFATAIAAVHELRGATAQRIAAPYARYYKRRDLDVPSWSTQPRLWRRALEVYDAAAPAADEAFIHRDYHPGNTLWLRGELSGIVDWERGSWGPIAVDLAHMRVNLAFGPRPEAAQRFVDAYAQITGRHVDSLAYWDIVDAVETSPMMSGHIHRQRLERFVTDAIRRLEQQAHS